MIPDADSHANDGPSEPDVTQAPHVIGRFLGVLRGTPGAYALALRHTDGAVAHLLWCPSCRAALHALVRGSRATDSARGLPTDEADRLLARLDEIDAMVEAAARAESRHSERVSAYCEALVADGEDAARQRYPQMAAHLDTCAECRAVVASVVDTLREDAEQPWSPSP